MYIESEKFFGLIDGFTGFFIMIDTASVVILQDEMIISDCSGVFAKFIADEVIIVDEPANNRKIENKRKNGDNENGLVKA